MCVQRAKFVSYFRKFGRRKFISPGRIGPCSGKGANAAKRRLCTTNSFSSRRTSDCERKYSGDQVSAKQHHSFLGVLAWSDFVGIPPLRRPPDVYSDRRLAPASRSSPLNP